MNNDIVPQGYMKDHKGSLVPEDMVKEIDKLRDTLVRDIVSGASKLSSILSDFKAKALDDIEAFIGLSAEKYQVKYGGVKGNVTLTSFDGSHRIIRAISDRICFDEKLLVAKQLIDECFKEWTSGSRSEIKALIDMAFKVDKQGKINTERILGLHRLNITDAKWLKAMAAINESIMVSSSKAYIRVYQRNKNGGYDQINLDMAAL
ncbi:MAG TPA: DUF3164 family protein [Candidatus Bathyarchaeia archaeon]|nr:DUF3164 family protein [Candidatus Bathyarchaeia archaeon]